MPRMNHNNMWNQHLPDCLNWGNDFFQLPKRDIATNRSTSMAYHNTLPSSSTYFSSTLNSDFQNYRIVSLESARDSYLHHPYVRRSCILQPIHIHGESCYDPRTIQCSISANNSQADYERLHFKRKSSAHPMALDTMNTNGCFGARSSNSIPLNQYQPNSITGPPHLWPHNSVSMVPGCLSTRPLQIGEGSGSQRNVRGRYGHANYLDDNFTGSQALGNLPQHMHQAENILNHGAMSFSSCQRFPSFEVGSFHHEIQPTPNSSAGSNGMDIDERFSSNFIENRRTTTSVPTLHGIGMRDNTSYGQRVHPYNSALGYSAVGLPGNIVEGGQFGNIPYLRDQRLLSMTGQSSERNERISSVSDRFSYRLDTTTDENYAHIRQTPEDVVVNDNRSLFYDSGAMFFDQHDDMRLDVENMSYEELIDLGERIGNVNTGLSENDISRCLTRMIYSCYQIQHEEEEKCVICLEEYENGQSIGRLNCRHDFHSNCIKKWLLIKNACPICKAAALGDTSKGKQVVSLL
ncbi:E3 ubiquitin ligase BIG BROTHER [Apostasia shenzhenica]|uniref:RING-type E3 ubiquitin transferase n=1 Tax=Apostasia shenzhenica TaxID=1088818 RepID=A0A2I0B680_9ASPA|nr:E3 ubiquitin ligase BIG BROTHER [Apostasia shenzhenica]